MEIMMAQIKAWEILESTELFKAGFFRLRKDRCRVPDGREHPGYYVMEFGDWVNVVPITKAGEIVLIEQYRHGSQEITLEIPGGAVDANEEGKLEVAVKRELLEETGYEAENIQKVGVHHPNPAIQNNRTHTFLASGCQLKERQNLDPFEEIAIRLVDLKEAFRLALEGKITHSLMLASLFLASQHLGANFNDLLAPPKGK
jgi:8-oxo-dGTP pyrophosphatase MutT (NUDIX family)